MERETTGKRKSWAEEEYARLMGVDALARQQKPKPLKEAVCKCAQRDAMHHEDRPHASTVYGPHHRVACPMYAKVEGERDA